VNAHPNPFRLLFVLAALVTAVFCGGCAHSTPDKNFLSYGSTTVGTADLGQLVPPATFAPWQDTLKFSNAHDAHLTAQLIQGGGEDCVDANNGSTNLTVHSDSWSSGGLYICTLKGGCDGITLSGVIVKHGQQVDVDLDDYSDQSALPCKNIYLNFTTSDGSPVTWWSLKGCRPVFLNPSQPYRCILYLTSAEGAFFDTVQRFLVNH